MASFLIALVVNAPATMASTIPAHNTDDHRHSADRCSTTEYELRPRKHKRGVDPISGALPFGLLWYGEPNAISNAIGYAQHCSRSHAAVIRVYDDAGNVIETHEHAGDFKQS